MAKSTIFDLTQDQFIAQLSAYPAKFSEIDIENAEHRRRLANAVKGSPKFMERVPSSLYCEEVNNAFLVTRLSATDSETSPHFERTLSGKPGFNLSSTVNIDYIDSKVEIPMKFGITFLFKLKVVSSVQFFNKLDLYIEDISMKSVCNRLTQLISSQAKIIVPAYLIDKQVTFYELARFYPKMIDALLRAIDLKSYGIEVVQCVVKETEMDSAIKQMITKGYFDIKQDKIREEYTERQAEFAMKMYQKKAEIYSESQFPGLLTETEKDAAIDRFIRKQKSIIETPKKIEYSEESKKEKKESWKEVKETIPEIEIAPYKKKKTAPIVVLLIVIGALIAAVPAILNKEIDYLFLFVGVGVAVLGSIVATLVIKSMNKKGLAEREKKVSEQKKKKEQKKPTDKSATEKPTVGATDGAVAVTPAPIAEAVAPSPEPKADSK